MRRANDWRVVRYRDEMKESWNSFIAEAKNGNFLFIRDYMEYHRDRFDDHSLLFVRDGRTIACLPAHRVDDVLSSHQGLTFGGLIMHETIRLSGVGKVVHALLDDMRANGFRTLCYRPMPHPYHRLPAEEDIFVLAGLGARIIDTKATCVVPAGKPAMYSRNRLRDITRFQGEGLTVKRSNDFSRFMDLCESYLLQQRGIRPVHTGKELERLASRFPDNIALYVVERGSELAGGLVIYLNATCVRSQYLAQSAYGQEFGVLPAIYDYILNNVLKNGTMFDFGHSTDPANRSHDEELHMYKESFGARTILISSYQLSID